MLWAPHRDVVKCSCTSQPWVFLICTAVDCSVSRETVWQQESQLCLAGASRSTAWLLPGQVEASLDWCSFPLTLQAFFQPFWFVFPLRFLPGCTALDTQRSRWEQPQRAGLGHLCCPGAPSEYSSALASALFGFRSSCLGNLNSGRLHS